MTKTGKVGTFGGLPIPTVTIFMDGFARGVDVLQRTNTAPQWKFSVGILADPTKGLFTMLLRRPGQG